MQLVIFDIDGTLTQTNHVDTCCYIQAVKDVLGLDEVEPTGRATGMPPTPALPQSLSSVPIAAHRPMRYSLNSMIDSSH